MLTSSLVVSIFSIFRNVALPSLPTADDSVSDADQAVRAAWALARRQADVRCDTECPICMVEFRGGPKARALVLLSCTHVFHGACIESFEQYARNERPTCPMCRAEYEKIPYT